MSPPSSSLGIRVETSSSTYRIPCRGGRSRASPCADDQTLVLFIWRSAAIDGDASRLDPKTTLRRTFGDMTWEVPGILDQMDAVDDVYFDRVSQIHVPRWNAGRVVLMAMRPPARRCWRERAPDWR
jgi:2-polyprenyl-6-methoxyphenol hydroxylase-like FAD-dependent oxidoreductase